MTSTLRNIIVLLAFLFSLKATAQTIPVNEALSFGHYPFVSTAFNRIFNAVALDSFFNKLSSLKKSGSRQISIVHIGDSHLQAGFISQQVREGLQSFFGDAGRGLVFPYQLAASNAPGDIISSSNTKWMYNRLAHPELNIDYGVSGFGIHTGYTTPVINFALRPDSDGVQVFNRMRLFTDSDSSNSWMIEAANNPTPYITNSDSSANMITLDQPASGFTLTALPNEERKSLYGVALYKYTAGVVYHTIGVNGARYDQYNNSPLFWQQLPLLKSDLYIISLGTNEAQRAAFNQIAFYEELDEFIAKLKLSSPGASILITTAADSYKGRTSNKILQQLNASLTNYCNAHYLPLWDLYRVGNGFGSAYNWSRRGLMSRDRIHFTAEGYRLQGNLLFTALAKSYNDYINSYN